MKTLNLNLETIVKYVVLTSLLIVSVLLIIESFKIDNFTL